MIDKLIDNPLTLSLKITNQFKIKKMQILSTEKILKSLKDQEMMTEKNVNDVNDFSNINEVIIIFFYFKYFFLN